ncbi:hypothetical protein GVAV_003457 [Gurleya vavrai]
MDKKMYRPVKEDLQTKNISLSEKIILNKEILINNEFKKEEITIQESQAHNPNKSPDPIVKIHIKNHNEKVLQYHKDKKNTEEGLSFKNDMQNDDFDNLFGICKQEYRGNNFLEYYEICFEKVCKDNNLVNMDEIESNAKIYDEMFGTLKDSIPDDMDKIKINEQKEECGNNADNSGKGVTKMIDFFESKTKNFR